LYIHKGEISYSTNESLLLKNIKLDDIKQRCLEIQKGVDIYLQFKKYRYSIWYSISGIEELWSNKDEAIAYIRLPKQF